MVLFSSCKLDIYICDRARVNAANSRPAYRLLSEAQTRCHMASLKRVAVVMETGMLMIDEYPE
jgi:hypothetical protein